jgi:hypothetical protein
MDWPAILDRIQARAHVEAIEPALLVEAMRRAIPAAATLAELEDRDAFLASAVGAIELMIARVMRIVLDHALDMDTSIAIPSRKVFSTTIASYANQLPLLATRARDVAERGGAPDPDEIAGRIVAAARTALALRHELLEQVLAVIAELASVTAPLADRNARDRDRGEAERLRWSALRRECEAVVREPYRALEAPLADRLARHEDLLDEPAPEREPTLAELIELD